MIAELKASGVGVIFISHRLNEVEHCADRVVVLRDGAVVGELARGEIEHDAMIRLMIGRDLKSLYMPPAAPAGRGGARDRGPADTSAIPTMRSTSPCARGEILGLAGLVGAGRTELARAIFGIDRPLGGDAAPRRRSRSRSARRATPSIAASILVPGGPQASRA